MRSWPWWARVLAVYAAARAFSTVVLLVVATTQAESGFTEAGPSYWHYVGRMWDASWYRHIAEQGYPAELPLGDDGLVRQNAWAFFPLFPLLVRGLMTITGGSWDVVAPLTATVLGGLAMLVVHRVVEAGAPRAVAARPGLPLATVAVVSAFPTAVVLQVAYTEALALLLVATVLLLLVRRHYAWAGLAVVALGLTRAVAAPMAVVVAVHLLVRWRDHRRGTDPFPPGQAAQVAGLGAVAAASGLLWPAITGWVTGVPDAYLLTQQAWRGVREVVPFGSWGYVLRFWFDGAWWLVAVGAVALVVAVLAARATRRLGPEPYAWSAAYLLWIAAVIEPGTSLARFLLLAFPLGAATAGAVTGRRSRAWLAGVVTVMCVLQVVWVATVWRLVPPSGWPP